MAQCEVRYKKYTAGDEKNSAAVAECKSPALKGSNYCPVSSMFTDALQP